MRKNYRRASGELTLRHVSEQAEDFLFEEFGGVDFNVFRGRAEFPQDILHPRLHSGKF
jgi:hypothetical protein